MHLSLIRGRVTIHGSLASATTKSPSSMWPILRNVLSAGEADIGIYMLILYRVCIVCDIVASLELRTVWNVLNRSSHSLLWILASHERLNNLVCWQQVCVTSYLPPSRAER